MFLVLVLLHFVSSNEDARLNKCFKCETKYFLSINECHANGWIKQISQDKYESCIPDIKNFYLPGIKATLLFAGLTLINIISVVFRKKMLYAKAYQNDKQHKRFNDSYLIQSRKGINLLIIKLFLFKCLPCQILCIII